MINWVSNEDKGTGDKEIFCDFCLLWGKIAQMKYVHITCYHVAFCIIALVLTSPLVTKHAVWHPYCTSAGGPDVVSVLVSFESFVDTSVVSVVSLSLSYVLAPF